MNQTWEKGKKTNFGPNFNPNLVPEFVGFTSTRSYTLLQAITMQFQGKLMNQTWENGNKPSFEPDFAPFCPNLGPKNVFPGFYLY